MSSSTFYPFKYASEALQLAEVTIDLDGVVGAGTKFIDSAHHNIDLTNLNNEWSQVALHVRVSDPNEQLQNVVPNLQSLESVAVWLLIKNKSTRLRRGIKLSRSGSYWKGSALLEKDDLARTTQLECVAVLANDLSPADGYAFNSNEKIADSISWSIYSDIPPAMPGGALNNKWVDFADSENEELRTRADCVWYLDLSDGEAPRLLLNQGVPLLRETLAVEGKTSRSARVRDSLIHSVLQSVITQLALYVIETANGCTFEELGDWQRKLLLSLARTEKDRSEELVACGWIANWDSGGETFQVLKEVSTAVQRHLNLRHSSEFLARSVEKAIGDDHA